MFQIVPNMKFKATRKVQKAAQAIIDKNVWPALRRMSAAHPKPQPDERLNFKKAVSAGGKDLAKLQELADAEEEDNKLEFKRRKGDPVPYGQTIQLYHVASRRYVRISTTTTSRREPSHLKVDLSEEITRGSWFRIMPRFKVRAEGDPIRGNDQVVIESVESVGQYWHASTLPLQELHPSAANHEINLSVNKSAFVMVLHASIMDHKPGCMKGGSVIQLFHKASPTLRAC